MCSLFFFGSILPASFPSISKLETCKFTVAAGLVLKAGPVVPVVRRSCRLAAGAAAGAAGRVRQGDAAPSTTDSEVAEEKPDAAGFAEEEAQQLQQKKRA